MTEESRGLNTRWEIYCGVCWNQAGGVGRDPEPWRAAVGRGRWVPQRIYPARQWARIYVPPTAPPPLFSGRWAERDLGHPNHPPIDGAPERPARRKVFENCPRHWFPVTPPGKGSKMSLSVTLTPEQALKEQRRNREEAKQRAITGRLCAVCGANLTGKRGQLTCSDDCRQWWSREGRALAAGRAYRPWKRG